MSKSKWNACHVTTSKVVSKRSRTPAFNTALGVWLSWHGIWFLLFRVAQPISFIFETNKLEGDFQYLHFHPCRERLLTPRVRDLSFRLGSYVMKHLKLGECFMERIMFPCFCVFAWGDVLNVTEKNLPKDHHLIWGCWMNHRFYPQRN